MVRHKYTSAWRPYSSVLTVQRCTVPANVLGHDQGLSTQRLARDRRRGGPIYVVDWRDNALDTSHPSVSGHPGWRAHRQGWQEERGTADTTSDERRGACNPTLGIPGLCVLELTSVCSGNLGEAAPPGAGAAETPVGEARKALSPLQPVIGGNSKQLEIPEERDALMASYPKLKAHLYMYRVCRTRGVCAGRAAHPQHKCV